MNKEEEYQKKIGKDSRCFLNATHCFCHMGYSDISPN